ncbi:unnamed protein product [Scytosiphon promiscuus]
MSTAEASRTLGGGRVRLVSDKERTGFVEAVLAGDLTPDFTTVAYHFSGWLDEDVVQAVFEVSSDPSEAVSALAGLSPPAEQASDEDSKGSTSQTPAASGDTTAITLDDETTAIIARANQRHAKTLEAMQAQRGSSTPPVVPIAAPARESEDVARAAAATPPSPPPASTTPPGSPPALAATAKTAPAKIGSDEEADPAPAASARDGDGGGSDSAKNMELEKVAAIITGEQEAAAKSSCAPTTPPESLFAVPRGVSVPSTRTAQLVIVNTAEKTVELPGFEAFIKMQHGKDKLFRFLAADHDLHSYYLLAKQHAREGAMKGGKVKVPRAAVVPVKASTTSTGRARSEDPDVEDIMRMMAGGGVTSS